MNKSDKIYEPPKAIIYRFDESEKILTASGNPEPQYAANALNQLFNGTTTTIERH